MQLLFKQEHLNACWLEVCSQFDSSLVQEPQSNRTFSATHPWVLWIFPQKSSPASYNFLNYQFYWFYFWKILVGSCYGPPPQSPKWGGESSKSPKWSSSLGGQSLSTYLAQKKIHTLIFEDRQLLSESILAVLLAFPEAYLGHGRHRASNKCTALLCHFFGKVNGSSINSICSLAIKHEVIDLIRAGSGTSSLRGQGHFDFAKAISITWKA